MEDYTLFDGNDVVEDDPFVAFSISFVQEINVYDYSR